MLKFILRLFLLLPLPVGMIVFNYTVDPAQQFSIGLEAQMAAAFHDDLNFEFFPYNHNERLLQYQYISTMTEQNSVIVAGSSRAMQLRRSLFPDQTFHNYSVPHGGLEDLAAIIYLHELQGLLPETMILGLDPWMLNAERARAVRRWGNLIPSYNRIQDIFNEEDSPFETSFGQTLFADSYAELLSPAYFQASLDLFISQLQNPERYATVARETTETFSENNIRLADGSLVYLASLREISVEEVRQDGINYAQTDPHNIFENFQRIDPQLSDSLDFIVDYLISRDIEVILLLSPYPPVVYDYWSTTEPYTTLLDVEDYYRQVALNYDIEIIGSYDPVLAGCDESEFFDGIHPKASCIEGILVNNE